MSAACYQGRRPAVRAVNSRVSAAALPLVVEGHGERTIVMIHGWPDTLRLWDGTVAALQDRWRCARFTLPGFDAHGPAGPCPLDQILDRIARTVDEASPGRPVTLLLHDWGCFFGYQYAMRHPSRVERVVGIDIGDAGSRQHRAEMTPRAIAGTLAYQWWLALAWRIGGSLGNRMARWMARRFRAPAPPADVTAAMGYPYAMQWFGVAGGFGRPRAFVPQVPMLYVFGERKPFAFHSSGWAQRIAALPGSRVVGLPTGHWVMTQRPAQFHAALREWLLATEGA